MHGKYELMHAWQQFLKLLCILKAPRINSFEWRTSRKIKRNVLNLRCTVRFSLTCTVASYLVIKLMIKYYLLLVLIVVYNKEWCIWCCFFIFSYWFLKRKSFESVAKKKSHKNLVLYQKGEDSSRFRLTWFPLYFFLFWTCCLYNFSCCYCIA